MSVAITNLVAAGIGGGLAKAPERLYAGTTVSASNRVRATNAAINAPASCAAMNPGALIGRIPEKLAVSARASVIAGFAKLVDEVPPPSYDDLHLQLVGRHFAEATVITDTTGGRGCIPVRRRLECIEMTWVIDPTVNRGTIRRRALNRG